MKERLREMIIEFGYIRGKIIHHQEMGNYGLSRRYLKMGYQLREEIFDLQIRMRSFN